MLKSFGYDGTYHDMSISVSVLLENPLECGLDATQLVFSVALRAKNGDAPRLEDFTFFIMDEAGQQYKARSIPYTKPNTETTFEDDEPVIRPDGLIVTEFRYEFLFQDLRIAFHYHPYQKTNIIALKH